MQAYDITLGWVPGYSKISGNELADECARFGYCAQEYTATLNLRIPYVVVKSHVDVFGIRRNQLEVGISTKLQKSSKKLVSFSKKTFCILTRVIKPEASK